MSSATYLYCVFRAPGPVSASGAPSGLPGCGPLRVLNVGDGLWLIASDAPLPEYGAEEIERRLQDLSWVSDRALAHEAVVEHFARAGTAVPLKLFTLFSSDERALAHIRENRERLERVLDRIAGCVEWGVRVRFDGSRARGALAAEAGADGDGSGTSFLLRKKREKDASRNLSARLRGEVDTAFDELSRQAAGAVRRDPAVSDGLLLDAAFLVPETRAADFEAAVERCATRLRPQACEVTLTGPWPPYNFAGEAG
jgi:Gas vesicle synthesis protein GvpL/GvpF